MVSVRAGRFRWGTGVRGLFEFPVAGEQGRVHGFGEGYVGRVVDGEVVRSSQQRGSRGRCGARRTGRAASRRVRGGRAGRRWCLLSSAAAVRMRPLGRRFGHGQPLALQPGPGQVPVGAVSRPGRRPGRWRQRRSRSSRIAATTSSSRDRSAESAARAVEDLHRVGSSAFHSRPRRYSWRDGERRPHAGGGSRASARARP